MARFTPDVYKKVSMDSVKNRTVSALSDSDNTRVNTILQKFITNFLAKHS